MRFRSFDPGGMPHCPDTDRLPLAPPNSLTRALRHKRPPRRRPPLCREEGADPPRQRFPQVNDHVTPRPRHLNPLGAVASSLTTRGSKGGGGGVVAHVLTQKHQGTRSLIDVAMRSHRFWVNVSHGDHTQQRPFFSFFFFFPYFWSWTVMTPNVLVLPLAEPSAACQLPVPAEPGLLQNKGG